jgi:hypothetical protein
MAQVHRDTDSRYCGARTEVGSQTTVFVNGLLVALEGDPESHGNGSLISASPGTVKVGAWPIIVIGDTAGGDDLAHLPGDTDPQGASPDVNSY